jgi:hypothetical protein
MDTKRFNVWKKLQKNALPTTVELGAVRFRTKTAGSDRWLGSAMKRSGTELTKLQSRKKQQETARNTNKVSRKRRTGL